MKIEPRNTLLPQGWRTCLLPDFVEVVMGQSPPSKTYNIKKIGLPFFQGKTEFGNLSPTVVKYCDTPGKIANKGATLLCVRAPVGPTNLAPENCCIGRGLAAIHPLDSISPMFILYLMRSVEPDISSAGTGSTFSAINRQFIEELEFDLPPLEEQHRIVAKIEELFSELDKGIENLKTAQDQIDVYRHTLLQQALNGKLKHSASSNTWVERTLGDLLAFLTSGSRGWAKFYADDGDLFIRAQNIKHDRLDLSDIAFVSLPDKTEGLRTRIKKGDLLITITGANVTKTALVERDMGIAYVSQHVALCRPTQDVLPKFLYWFVVAETSGRKQLKKMAYGAGKPGLNLENIRSVIISLPTLSEQKNIVDAIEEKLFEIEQLQQTIATALRQTEALRQSILKKAYAGQLVPQDANDESASVLLARIQTEKSAQPSSKKARK